MDTFPGLCGYSLAELWNIRIQNAIPMMWIYVDGDDRSGGDDGSDGYDGYDSEEEDDYEDDYDYYHEDDYDDDEEVHGMTKLPPKISNPKSLLSWHRFSERFAPNTSIKQDTCV